MRIEKALRIYLAANTRATAKSTLNHYSVTINQWELVCGHSLRTLTDDNLARFMRWLADEGRAPATVNQKRNYICAFWRWCCKRGMLRRWPTVAAVVEPERLPEAWTQEQLAKLFAACRRQRGYVSGIPAGDFWHSIHVWWYYTGERAHATLKAKWENYDGQTLLIPAEVRKGKHKSMLYDLVPPLVESIESIREPTRELIWPWDRDVSMFYHRYKTLVLGAGLPYTRWKSGPQKMRRSFASHLKKAGGDATAALRHSSTALTHKSYLDPRIAKEQNQSALLPRVG